MKKFGLMTLCLCLFCSPAEAFRLSQKFDVTIGPFDASRTEFAYTYSPQEFRVNSAVQTFGLFNTIYPFKADYETSGRFAKDTLVTQSYNYRSQSRFNKRTKELVYDNNGNLLYRLSSKNGKKKKVMIAQDDKNANTTDFQSVFAEMIRQYNTMRFCDSRMEVFDGKRRFDVIFTDEGKDTLPQLDNSPFFGEAVKCSMYIDRLDSDDDDLLMQITLDRPINFWIMEQDGKPFVARVHINNTPLGELTAATTQVTIEE